MLIVYRESTVEVFLKRFRLLCVLRRSKLFQVTGPVNVDVFEAHKVVPDVGNIDLNNESRQGDEIDSASGVLSKNDVSASKAAKDEESSPSVTQEPKTVAKKPIPRAKVPFEKGYSQMDWLKLTRTHPDLAGTLYLHNKYIFIIITD